MPGMAKLLVRLPLLLFLLFPTLFAEVIPLGDPSPRQNQWNFYSTRLNISGKAAQVPGDIFNDLQAVGLIRDPLYGQGDGLYRWVGHLDWTYERSVQLSQEVQNSNFVLLQIQGLDGPASIWLNSRHVANVDNQFRSYTFNVKPFIVFGLNVLRIAFQSPVRVAKKKARAYQVFNVHALPPECPPAVYHGECHVNQLRRMQASFSWDWGPGMATVGIWRPIQLEYFDHLSIHTFSPVVQAVPGTSNFLVNISLSLHCSPSASRLALRLSLPELGLSKHFQIEACSQLTLHNLTMFVPGQKVQLWWPRGYGQQRLYQLDLAIFDANGKLLENNQKRIAFRTILLNQSLVDGSDPGKGLLFQFEVNGVPVFLKGTNWVPVSSFPARDHSLRRLFLLRSMAEANMNSLRVWGGGIYELEEFYDLTDELGLLVWQDLMFACALYPTDSAFLRNVRSEVEEQLLRLRHHPSILCWAGNNENELAIRSKWYAEWNYPEEAQARDYLALYKAAIQPLAQSLDPSRPFLLSSPSNGAETEKEGGLSQNPADPKFGDVHFYTELDNLWRDQTYPVPRCASEFGVQSMPLRGTMLRWMDQADWRYGSETLVRRQHHPGGVLSLPGMVFQHFLFPEDERPRNANSALMEGNGTSFIDNFAFLSQAHQAIALQAQIEHYRRWRSQLDGNGQGRTMCALYWQLNDVWAAPTWSTVDFDLRWKMAQHFVGRAFAPLIVSLFLDPSQQLRLFLLSDLTRPVRNVSVRLEMFLLHFGLAPIFSGATNMPEVPALSAIEVPLPTMGENGRLSGYSPTTANDYLVTATLLDANGQPLSPKAVLLPDKMFKVGQYGQATLTNFKNESNELFELTISANNVLPLVWLDLSDQFKFDHPEVLFHFEENAFAMTTKEERTRLKLFSNPNRVNICRSDIQITVL